MKSAQVASALNSMLQVRSQTLSYRATVMDASVDDGFCIVRLDQGGVRRVLVPRGATVEYGATVMVSKMAGQNQLMLVGAGSTSNINTTIIEAGSSTSSGGESGGGSVSFSAEAESIFTANDGVISLDPQAAGKFWGGPATGADSFPTFRFLTAEDIDNLDVTWTGSHRFNQVISQHSDAGAAFVAWLYSDQNINGSGPSFSTFRSQGNESTPTPVTTGNVLGRFTGRGYDGSWPGTSSGSVDILAAQDHAPGQHGTRLAFRTTDNDTATAIIGTTIEPDGSVKTISIETDEFRLTTAPIEGGVMVSDVDGVGHWAAAGNALPDGTTTGDFLRYNSVSESWEVSTEPIALRGLVLTPALSALLEVEGSMYYNSASKTVMVCTDI